MAKKLPKYVNAYRNKQRKNQKLYYYFRRENMKKGIPLPGNPDSDEFNIAYGEALARTSNMAVNTPTEIGAERIKPGTIAALTAHYLKSAAWLDLAKDTRQTRWPLLERFREQYGHLPFARLRPKDIEFLLSKISSPAMKDHWLRTIRGLLKSGIPVLLEDDPTKGIKVKQPKSEGHHTWTEAEIEQYRAHHPLGTQARLVLEFALESASRKGEIVRLGQQHLYRDSNGQWRIKIKRLKGSRDVDILVTPELQAACEAMPKTDLVYIVGQKGGALSKITLGHRFAEWATEAGLPKHCRLHGLKKSSMVGLALAGASAPELMAVSGHKSLAQAQRYIEAAFEHTELADAAIGKVRTKRGEKSTNTASGDLLTGPETRIKRGFPK
jgi:integrase